MEAVKCSPKRGDFGHQAGRYGTDDIICDRHTGLKAFVCGHKFVQSVQCKEAELRLNSFL